MQDQLSAAELDALLSVAGTMIPADRQLGMPGADDPAILADIAKSIGRDLPLVRNALKAIAARSHGGVPTEASINEWYAGGGAPAVALGRAVLGAYYRDDRVLLAIGHEARAPFPKGYVLEQGDWSLLEAVRHRPLLWRDDRKAPAGER
jgi:hypothetical protein